MVRISSKPGKKGKRVKVISFDPTSHDDCVVALGEIAANQPLWRIVYDLGERIGMNDTSKDTRRYSRRMMMAASDMQERIG